MSMEHKHSPNPPAKKGWLKFLDQSEIPLAVYAVIFITMILLWVFQHLHPDVLMGFFTELLGAAFTLFIIDTLLVRSKIKRWKGVQQHIDYLIARDVNRLRDGLAVRAFGFDPVISGERSEDQVSRVREQRATLLSEMETRSPEEIAACLARASLFTENTYAYLQERAGALWDVFNMRYSEYMDPKLVSALIRLHTHVNDLGGHLRQYARATAFPDDASYYHAIGLQGASVSLREILKMVNELKRQGYSMTASIAVD
ncbi:hypothetical protein [Marinobacter alkaliphilus]|uniref:hypothetical protein n=1 Tax=Marinobacter alkaliphilus TaxID=254719 RepID=UPI003D811E5B|nr:hypothetical protein PBN92_19515 [Marinobacter alkaliphilus]